MATSSTPRTHPEKDNITMNNKSLRELVWELLLDADAGCRYHSLRASFLSGLNNIFLIIIFFASLLGFLTEGLVCRSSSFISMLLSVIPLIFWKNSINHHLSLKSRFHILRSQIEKEWNNDGFTYESYSTLKEEYDRITQEESERFIVAEAFCYNSVFRARSCDQSYFINIPTFQCYLMNIWPFYSFLP